ncbi:MAG TPA: LemA family protein [Bacillota bacterium]|jgi:LemA protein|nr:LemA family protein [Peptococcaceae bacterium MAG4]NLW37855.1 LemA family protein [Peptococcaceae bacterium]HPU35706.1 LemA family protein [Bacillota bacterium]HPZ43738.1 LemA family protein [Bacillota bacterium]HQD75139.1 LemA family protein [Bacillota bacterium]
MRRWLIPAGIIVVLAIFLLSGYNNLVRLNEAVNSSWSQVENQLQRRADLIPNLVQTVKGYAAHEEEIFTQVAEARSKLAGAATVSEAAQADQALNSALARLLAIAENYPQLKADANFRALQDELAGTENRIATARMDYNNAVQAYNTKIKVFPTSLYAGIFGFGPKDYFKAAESAGEVPKVDFSN